MVGRSSRWGMRARHALGCIFDPSDRVMCEVTYIRRRFFRVQEMAGGAMASARTGFAHIIELRSFRDGSCTFAKLPCSFGDKAARSIAIIDALLAADIPDDEGSATIR